MIGDSLEIAFDSISPEKNLPVSGGGSRRSDWEVDIYANFGGRFPSRYLLRTQESVAEPYRHSFDRLGHQVHKN